MFLVEVIGQGGLKAPPSGLLLGVFGCSGSLNPHETLLGASGALKPSWGLQGVSGISGLPKSWSSPISFVLGLFRIFY